MRRFLTITLTGAALGGLGLLASGCGGSSEAHVASLEATTTTATSTDRTATTASDDPELARLKFARCLREHGVNIPDPTTRAGGGQRFNRVRITADRKTLERAQRACGDLLPRNPNLDNPERRAELQDALLKFARCMREHGIDFPDPQLGSGGRGFLFRVTPGNRARLNPESKAFQEAQQACEKHLPNFGPGRGGGPP
jgi:hypothetical protein